MNWTAGESLAPNEAGNLWTATIDIENHGAAIALHARTEEEAVRRRNFVLAACVDATHKGEMLSETQVLNTAAAHGFGRMVAKEKKHRVAPPPPDIFVGAWDNFMALARAIPTIYRDRLLGLRDSLQSVIGQHCLNDDQIVQAVERMKAGVAPSTEPTVEQVAAFKLEFFQAQSQNCTHNECVRRALTAAMKTVNL
jgi:hypothetical protein